jgi:hypothetical protein
MASTTKTKNLDELWQMLADQSGVNPRVISVQRVSDDGAFRATVVGAVRDFSGDQSRLDAACDRLRLKYRLI